jgi:hypothetical protein
LFIGATDNDHFRQARTQPGPRSAIHFPRPGPPTRLLVEIGADMARLRGLTGQRHRQPRIRIVATQIARQMGNDAVSH